MTIYFKFKPNFNHTQQTIYSDLNFLVYFMFFHKPLNNPSISSYISYFISSGVSGYICIYVFNYPIMWTVNYLYILYK